MFEKTGLLAIATVVCLTLMAPAHPAQALETGSQGASCQPSAGYQYTFIECGQPSPVFMDRIRYHLSSNFQDAGSCGADQLPEFHLGSVTVHLGGALGTAAAYLVGKTQHRLTHRPCGVLKR